MKRLTQTSILAAALLASLATVRAQPLAVVNGTVLDGNGGEPIRNGVVVIERKRIVAVGGSETRIPAGAKRIDARGKYVIPGMMDANVHLLYDISPEYMVKFEDRFEQIAREGAQVALKNGITTIFETHGPLEPLKTARDKIKSGEVPGARLFIAGNVIGVDGPLSTDFHRQSVTGVSESTIARINAMWEQRTGHEVLYMSPQELRVRIREYLDKGPDFMKIGINGHGSWTGHMLSFTPQALKVLVEEARARGLTVQTHTMTVEGLRIFAEGDFDLGQHCSTTWRPVRPDSKRLELIPDSTLKLLVERKRNCTLNAYTYTELRRRIGDENGVVDLDSVASVPSAGPNAQWNADTLIQHLNELKMIKAGVTLLMTTDAGVPWIDSPTIHRTTPCWRNKGQCTHFLGEGHIAWLRAVREKGLSPMAALQAATRNVAAAYKLHELGTLEAGKLADLVILDGDPLGDVDNYGKVHLVMKEGQVIDRDSLPVDQVLTPLNAPRLRAR